MGVRRVAGCRVYCLSDNEEMESVGVRWLSMEALTSGAKGLRRVCVGVCVCVASALDMNHLFKNKALLQRKTSSFFHKLLH